MREDIEVKDKRGPDRAQRSCEYAPRIDIGNELFDLYSHATRLFSSDRRWLQQQQQPEAPPATEHSGRSQSSTPAKGCEECDGRAAGWWMLCFSSIPFRFPPSLLFFHSILFFLSRIILILLSSRSISMVPSFSPEQSWHSPLLLHLLLRFLIVSFHRSAFVFVRPQTLFSSPL